MASTYLRRRPRIERRRLSAADLVRLPGSAFQRDELPDPRIGAQDAPGLDPAFSLNANALPRPGRTMFLPEGPNLPAPDTAAGILETPVYPPEFKPTQEIPYTELSDPFAKQPTGMDVEGEPVGFSGRATSPSDERKTYVNAEHGFGSPTALALLSAGLGILANNTGHYGQAGPAIGKGGLIGLNTFTQLKQQQADQRRQEAQMSMQRDQHRAYQRQVAAQELRAQRDESQDNRNQALMRMLTEMPENDPNRGRVLERLMLESGQFPAYVKAQQGPATKRTAGGSSLSQALNTLAEYETEVEAGREPSRELELAKQNAMAFLGQKQLVQDKVTGRFYEKPRYELPAYAQKGETNGLRELPLPDANKPGRRPIEQKDQEWLENQGSLLKGYDQLIADYKPEFGGWKLDAAGEFALKLGRRLPESMIGAKNKAEAEWFMSYYAVTNVERLAQTGLTLTGSELQAYERAAPVPADDSATIQRKIEQRRQIIQNKIVGRMNGLVSDGYNPTSVERYLGLHESDGSEAGDPTSSAKSNAAEAEIERKRKKYHLEPRRGGASGRY